MQLLPEVIFVWIDAVRWFELGERLSETLSAWQSWRTCVNVSDTQLLTVWNVSAVSAHQQPVTVSLAIYARRRVEPSHTRFDALHVLHVADALLPVRSTNPSAAAARYSLRLPGNSSHDPLVTKTV